MSRVIAQMRQSRLHIEYWWESQKEGDHCEDKDIGGWTILKLSLERQVEMVCIGLIWLRIGISGGLLRTRNEPSGSMKCWDILV
jgi:hypothetical protein